MRVCFWCSVLLSLLAASVAQGDAMEFDSHWKFILGDVSSGHQVDCDDRAWRVLDLPHDWAFEADYDKDAAQGDRGGYKPGGIGWYRKAFDFSSDWKNRRVFISFDAVFMNSEVWLNGHVLGKRPYGYISFVYDLTPYLQPGTNVLAVRVDCSLEPAARWYHGCGIYGHVTLLTWAPVHVVADGVAITTPHVSDADATVAVATEVANTSDQERTLTLETTLLDPTGKPVDSAKQEIGIPSGATRVIQQTLKVVDPQRWDTVTPFLYTAASRITSTGQTLDETMTRFGIRTLRWDTDTGFWLNEKNVKLKGVCDHLEAGPVGAASPDEIIAWKIRLLKEMGCNAIRTAHNPQVPIFYDLCDEMGMLVMDEIFDGWKRKAAQDYGKQAFHQWWERDLRAWLRRDRNHPSVVIWSLGNETGGDIARELVRVCHEVDPSRLVTSGHSGTKQMDVEGVNGASEKMSFFAHVPDKPFVATEAPHTWQVRGYYRTQTWFRDGYPNKRQDPFPCPDLTEEEVFHYDWAPSGGDRNPKQIFNSSYDNGMVRITARKNWELMRDLPWYSGHFRWTGFDYLGEAGYVHGGWPFRAFMGGPLDLAGFKKDLYYFYQSQWTDQPMVHILPHWTHPQMELETKIPVWVYSNCDEVELLLNGKSLGKDRPGKKWDQMQCDWIVPWSPGTIEAVGYRNGRQAVRTLHTTAGAPSALEIAVAGEICPIITVSEVDDKGVSCPYAENRIHYHLDGPARILSLESGNPVNTESNYGTTSRTAFFGWARAFLQTTASKGDISAVIGAICGQPQLLTSNSVTIDVQSCLIRGQAPRRKPKVFYSLDGSVPLTPYVAGFEVQPGTRVRAAVYDDDTFLFDMEERFGPGLGLYWGDGKATPQVATGDQAEEARFKGATVKRSGSGFNGKGYLDFGHNNGSVEWYQENDGSPGTFTLRFRYSGKVKGRAGRSMKLSVNGIDTELFFKNAANWGDDWKPLQVDVRLNSGANRIVLSTIGRGGMYIDELTVD